MKNVKDIYLNLHSNIFEKLNNYNYIKLIFAAVNALLAVVWMNLSYIELQADTVLLVIIVSIVTGYGVGDRFYRVRIKKRYIAIVAFFFSFALIGSRGIVYPINSTFSLGRCLEFVITYLWTIPLIYLLFDIMHMSFEGNKSIKYKDNFFYSFVIALLLIPMIISLIAFNPGIVSYDTWESMVYCVPNIVGMHSWRSPFYILLLKLILSIWDSPYAVVITQIFFWTALWTSAIRFLREKVEISDNVLIILSAFLGTSISNMMYIVSIWKDIQYTMCLFWLTLVIAKLVFKDEEKSIWLYVQLVLSLIGVFFFRLNGVVPCVLTMIVLVCVFRKDKKTIISILVSVLLIGLIQYPLFSALEIKYDRPGGKYIGLGQDLVGTYYNGGQVDDETEEIIRVLTNDNLSDFTYNPYYANISYKLDVPMSKFIICYIRTFIRNPRLMINCILCRNDVIWDVFGGEDCFVNLVNYQGEYETMYDWADHYPSRHSNLFSSMLGDYAGQTAKGQLTNIIYWRSGIWMCLMIAVVFYLISQKRKLEFIVFVPLVGQIIGLMLSTGWSDFRYYWSINTLSVFIGIYMISLKRKNV